jgi:CRISPR-associated endonuclease Csn1
MEKILGIDTGTNSLGWAIVEKQDDKYVLLDKGVNIFQEGVKIEKGIESSKAAEKTTHKATRVRYYRIKLRKIQLLKILSDNQLCPPVSKEELSMWRLHKVYPKNELLLKWESTDNKEDKTPYACRYKCLTEKLDLTDISQRYILGRALYHINQRRGFLSNRKSEDSEEDGTVKTGISELSQEMHDAGCQYLGEYFYKLYQKGEKIRKHYTARNEHYLSEFRAICEKQGLDKDLANKIEHAIFFQRPLKSQKGLVGHCLFETNKPKCPASHPLFEEFRMLGFINNIKIQTPKDDVLRPLNEEERNKILPKFFRKSKPSFDFEDIAKELAGKNNYAFYKNPKGKPYLFNYHMDSSVPGCPLTASLKDLFGEDWINGICEVYDKAQGKNSLQIINDIWHVLFNFPDKDHVIAFGKEHLQLTDEDAKKFGNIRVNSDYASLSLKAIRKILPYLRMGLIYPIATFLGNLEKIVPAEIWNHEDQRNLIIDEVLEAIAAKDNNPADQRTTEMCIKDYLKAKFNVEDKQLNKLYHPSMIESYPRVPEDKNELGSPRISSVRNPMAMRSLFRLRHVVNTLLKEGKIDRNTTIHIEFARALNDANKRQALYRFNKENENDREKAKNEIIKLYEEATNSTIVPTDTDILKYQLWEEQNHRCIYTDKQIGIADFLGPEPKFDIEHTIPRSVGGDTTKMNLTLCDSKFNREIKQTCIPSQLSNHDEILQRVESWKDKYEDLDKRIRKIRTSSSMSKYQKDKKIQDRNLLKLKRDYWYGKYQRFVMTSVPEGFSRRQGTDISIISKYGRLFLKSFFNKVFTVKGLATSDFRKIWGIQDIYSKKARVNHVHHCIDAIVIACMGPGEYNKLAQYYRDEENYEWYGASKTHFDLPWPTFAADINNIQKEIIVAHSTQDNLAKQGRKLSEHGKRSDTARASLHNDTYYGAIERDGEIKYVVRKALDETFKESDIKNIVDETVKEKVQLAVKRYKSLKEAIAHTIWMNEEKGIAIKKVRCFTPSVTRPVNIRHHRDVSPKEYKQQYHVQNDTNYAMAIYIGQDKKGKTKKTFELINNLDACAYNKASNDKESMGNSMVPLTKKDYPLAYILKKGTMVLLYENSPEELDSQETMVKRLYKVTGMTSIVINGRNYGIITLVHAQEARPSGDLKITKGVFKEKDEYRPKIQLYHTQINALVQGYDFDINEIGEIKMR